MLKRDEIADATSCFNKAKDNEMVFVLLGRDLATPATIRAWVQARLKLHLNRSDDPQIQEALAAAAQLETTDDGQQFTTVLSPPLPLYSNPVSPIEWQAAVDAFFVACCGLRLRFWKHIKYLLDNETEAPSRKMQLALLRAIYSRGDGQHLIDFLKNGSTPTWQEQLGMLPKSD
jgi:hypothetical protein